MSDLWDWLYAKKDGDPAGANAVRDLARRRVDVAWDHLDKRLDADQPYLV